MYKRLLISLIFSFFAFLFIKTNVAFANLTLNVGGYGMTVNQTVGVHKGTILLSASGTCPSGGALVALDMYIDSKSQGFISDPSLTSPNTYNWTTSGYTNGSTHDIEADMWCDFGGGNFQNYPEFFHVVLAPTATLHIREDLNGDNTCTAGEPGAEWASYNFTAPGDSGAGTVGSPYSPFSLLLSSSGSYNFTALSGIAPQSGVTWTVVGTSSVTYSIPGPVPGLPSITGPSLQSCFSVIRGCPGTCGTSVLQACGNTNGSISSNTAENNWCKANVSSSSWCVTCDSGPLPPTPTSAPGVPTATPTPAPSLGTIRGTVYVDSNQNGVRDGGELGYQGASVVIAGLVSNTNSTGIYTRTISPGTYTVDLLVPSGYAATTTDPRTGVVVTANTFTVVNFGIAPSISCATFTASDSTVNAGDTTTLTVDGCTIIEDPPDADPPPVINWDPGAPECSDGIDNDADTLVDGNDPNCHTDNNAGNDASYDPIDTSERATPQCDNNSDDDGDGLIDEADPGCHTDANPGYLPSWDPTDDNETQPGNVCDDALVTAASYNSTGGQATWQAPGRVCNSTSCSVDAIVHDGVGGTDTYPLSGGITINPYHTITGFVYKDTNNNNCSDKIPHTSSIDIAINGGSNPLPVPVNNSDGSYTVTDTGTCSPATRSLIVQPASPNITAKGYFEDGGGFTTGGLLVGKTLSIPNITQVSTVDFCLSPETLDAWIQTENGDVRFNLVNDPVPANKSASLDNSNPSLFFSSTNDSEFGDEGGAISSKNWVVDREYSYNSDYEGGLGSMSYDFYKSRARQKGATIKPLSDKCNLTNCQLTGTNKLKEDGIYEVDGDLTLTDYQHQNRTHIVILVKGKTFINTEIRVPKEGGDEGHTNLFILASKGDMRIRAEVGTTNLNVKTSNLDGFYTSQGRIILQSYDQGCRNGRPDERLNVRGALVANALNPFASDGSGKLVNNRSLCTANNARYPTLYVAMRPDMLMEMTDFYKTTIQNWRELRP